MTASEGKSIVAVDWVVKLPSTSEGGLLMSTSESELGDKLVELPTNDCGPTGLFGGTDTTD